MPSTGSSSGGDAYNATLLPWESIAYAPSADVSLSSHDHSLSSFGPESHVGAYDCAWKVDTYVSCLQGKLVLSLWIG